MVSRIDMYAVGSKSERSRPSLLSHRRFFSLVKLENFYCTVGIDTVSKTTVTVYRHGAYSSLKPGLKGSRAPRGKDTFEPSHPCMPSTIGSPFPFYSNNNKTATKALIASPHYEVL